MKLKSLMLILLLAPALAAANETYTVQLSGAEEVPPVETNARGNVIAKVRGGRLSYKLIVAGLEDIVASHIHCAPAGVNGPVGVTLFAGSPRTVSGILAQGEILMPNDGNACGWTSVDDIVNAMSSGQAYVNVHTLASLPGEIRGQF